MRRRSLMLVAVLSIAAASCGQVSDSSGLSSTVAVHGDWTIDVYNPDGTLDRHLEFSNDLTAVGADALASLAAGKVVAQTWSVSVDSATDVPPCPASSPDTACRVGNDNAAVATQPGAILLTASQTATRSGQIGAVFTTLVTATCDPGGCFAGPPAGSRTYNFTSTDIVDPATGGEYVIAEGQTFDITVEISFTSG